MIHNPQHTIKTLVVQTPRRLQLGFADGAQLVVDLAATIGKHRALQALNDPGLFASARVDARGGYVVWIEDELELAADNLRNMAVEQAGGIGHERLWTWLHANTLTQERAADAIGISRRMLNYYLSGAKPIPKTVWLACQGWEAQRKKKVRHGAGQQKFGSRGHLKGAARI